MQVISPIQVTDEVLVYSNVPENDYSEWSAGTAYSVGQRVRVTSVHRVYEALVANTGVDPTVNNGNRWVEVGATNRWRAFDQKIGQQVRYPEIISYELRISRTVDGIAFMGLSAGSVRIRVIDQAGVLRSDVTTSLIDTSDIVDWWTFYAWEPQYVTSITLPMHATASNRIYIDVISEAGIAKVGQIALGRILNLGIMTVGTSTGITDYSTQERDTFGNTFIVRRAAADRVSFQFAFPVADTFRVKRIIARLRATPAVFSAGMNTEHLGTTIFGFLAGDLDIPLTSGPYAFATLEIEGLV